MNDILFNVQDPVYDLSVFNEPSPRAGLERADNYKNHRMLTSKKTPRVGPGKRAWEWDRVLSSREFRRLQFLRQLPLGWLVFPSATYTRYAHSIGVYALGEMSLAQSRIKTMDAKKQIKPFWSWAHERNLDKAFLAALLLHDIGSFPFWHILQSLFPNITHKELGSALILFDHLPEGARFRGIYKKNLQKLKLPDIGQIHNSYHGGLLSSILKKNFDTLSRAVVCWLIGGYREQPDAFGQQPFTGISEQFIREQIDQDKEKGLWNGTFEDLRVLKVLVSGLLDLEKFDHCHRHSYFSGIKVGNFNFIDFVKGTTIEVPLPGSDPEINFSKSAAAQAVTMLQSRETIRRCLFLRPEALALQAMFRWAADRHIRSIDFADKDDRLLWLFMTEDEIVCELRTSNSPSVRLMLDMVVNGNTYKFNKRGSVKDNVGIKDVQDLNGRLENLAEDADINGSGDKLPEVVWHLPAAVHESDLDSGGHWLDLGQIKRKNNKFGQRDLEIFDFLSNVRKAERKSISFFLHPMQTLTRQVELFYSKLDALIHFD